MKKTDLAVVAFIYIVCAGFGWYSFALPEPAQVYPLLILCALALLNTFLLAKMLFLAYKKGSTSGLESFADFAPKQFFGILGFAILYLVLMYFAGFYISTILFMFACLYLLKVRVLYILLSIVVIIALVYCAFGWFLGVKLPVGLIFG